MIILLFLLFIFPYIDSAAPGTNGDINSNQLAATIQSEAKQYLWSFGYLNPSKVKDDNGKEIDEPTKYDLQTALARFQKSFLIYRSGVVDVPTFTMISETRCGNRDLFKGEPVIELTKKELWQKKVLLWNITSFPNNISPQSTREACDEAFEKWRKVADFEFVEVAEKEKADIVISFISVPDAVLNVAGRATKPLKSQIVLDRDRTWTYRNQQSNGLSLFHTLLHSIGHVLGLHHSFYRGSIMYPMLEAIIRPNGKLEDIPNTDRISIRKLYGLSLPLTASADVDPSTSSKCPKYIDSVSAISNNDWLLFRGDKIWKLQNKKFIGNEANIQQVFPKGPEFVNATVVSDGLFLLFAERIIYGYDFDGVSFNEANGYPKELHERVLFYPQGAFPLNNGSIVLFSGDVFATYDVKENRPSFLNDKTRYFPNLPSDIRSGISKDIRSSDSYYMFDESTVSDYDMASKQVIQLHSIADFFTCV